VQGLVLTGPETRRERVPSAPPIFDGNWKP